jgi:hypothetical protein
MIIYKIRNKNNSELYLKGTPTYNSWDKDGRIFQTLGKLRTFLTNSLNMDSKRGTNKIGDWEVIEFELIEQSAKGVHEMIKPAQLIKMLTR